MSTATVLRDVAAREGPDTARVRVHEIDGVRGWAALSVLLYHLFWETFGLLVPAFRSDGLHFVLNGPLAVFIFFVLSGDALSWPFISTGNAGVLDRTVVKRYFRLAIPIFLSCLIAFFILRGGLAFNRQAGDVVHRPDWLGSFLSFQPTPVGLFNYAFRRVFVDFPCDMDTSFCYSYNAFLWPMRIELIGSFFVFALCYGLTKHRRGLSLVLGAMGISFFLSEYYVLFFTGLAFALLRRGGVFERLRSGMFGRFVAPGLIALAAAADTIDYAWGLKLNRIVQLPNRLSTVLAILIVFSIYSNKWLVDFFSNRVSRWLGKASFPIYLLQFSVLCSLTSFLIVQADAAGRLDTTAIGAIIAASLVVTLAAGWIFEGLERYCLRRLDQLVRLALD